MRLSLCISSIKINTSLSVYFFNKRYITLRVNMKRSASTALAEDDISENSIDPSVLLKEITEDRQNAAKSILEFDFKKKRVEILSEAKEVAENSNGIVYWMHRDCRVQDNWALLFTQKLALKNKVSLHVLFCLPPFYMQYTLRHYKFLLKGLQEVEEECKNLNINFHLLCGSPPNLVSKFVDDKKIGAVVCDFLPLRQAIEWQHSVIDSVPLNVPVICVDAHNIVPCWVASDKQEHGARTIRNKINSQLATFLTPFPAVIKHPYGDYSAEIIKWDDILLNCEVDKTVDEVDWAIGGYTKGIEMLDSFCSKRLPNFAAKRNDPCSNALSNLSPWLHFGHISAQRCILTVRKYKTRYIESVNSYCEEAIIRRELSDNFCYYNTNYDRIEGAASWAMTTLNDHRKDKREYVYTREELELSKTHDELWNSAQIELVKSGKLHGFMRMYWAKKILEWTDTPENALSTALYFNDKYALDGNDPNGYVGVMWSICGVHDQGWAERAVFGKIRYMNYQGCKRKFDVNAYIVRWGGKDHSAVSKKGKNDKHATKKKKK